MRAGRTSGLKGKASEPAGWGSRASQWGLHAPMSARFRLSLILHAARACGPGVCTVMEWCGVFSGMEGRGGSREEQGEGLEGLEVATTPRCPSTCRGLRVIRSLSAVAPSVCFSRRGGGAAGLGPDVPDACSELVIRAGRDWVTGRASSSTRAGRGSWRTQNWAQGWLKKARTHELARSLPKGRPSSGSPPGQTLGLVGVPRAAVADPFLALGRGQELLLRV